MATDVGEGQTVWEATMDDRYRVTVTRLASHRGRLRIVDTASEELLHEEEVHLEYRAIFGPDVADVAEWQETAVRVVDSH